MTRIAVIGAGNWGFNILRTIHGLDALAGVVEPFAANAARIKEFDAGIAVHGSLGELLQATKCDAVAIATPVATHFDVAREALTAGLDVFVEKPLTDRLESTRELIALAAANDAILMVGHMLLYQPAVQFLQQAIAGGDIGDLLSLHQWRRNLGTVRTHENALWSLGVHDVAVANYLLGELPDEVRAVGQDGLQAGIEDEVHMHCRYPSGVSSHLHVSWLWPVKDRGVAVIGRRGMLTYDEGTQEVTLHRDHIDAGLKKQAGGAEVVFSGAGQPLELEMKHFIECIASRATPISGPANAEAVVSILVRAQEQLNE